MFIVVNGFTGYERTGYDAIAIIKKFQNGRTDQTQTVERLIKAQMELTLRHMGRREVDQVIESPLRLTYIGVNKKILIMRSRRFAVSFVQQNSIEIQRNSCPGLACPSGVAIVSVDPADIGERFRRERPAFWQEPDLVDVVRSFVQRQIDAKLVDVGGPIEILRITVDGKANWEQQETCKEPIEKSNLPAKRRGRKE
jgi:hypothetical protein